MVVAKAIAHAVRGIAAGLRRESCCPKLHFAGWR
jgi:hypothetical protein